jgi:hypothetical protein
MKYTIGDKVFLGDKKCKVIATREIPHNPTIDPYNRKEVYPDEGKDYLLFILKKIENQEEHYLGTISVTENLIEDMSW